MNVAVCHLSAEKRLLFQERRQPPRAQPKRNASAGGNIPRNPQQPNSLRNVTPQGQRGNQPQRFGQELDRRGAFSPQGNNAVPNPAGGPNQQPEPPDNPNDRRINGRQENVGLKAATAVKSAAEGIMNVFDVVNTLRDLPKALGDMLNGMVEGFADKGKGVDELQKDIVQLEQEKTALETQKQSVQKDSDQFFDIEDEIASKNASIKRKTQRIDQLKNEPLIRNRASELAGRLGVPGVRTSIDPNNNVALSSKSRESLQAARQRLQSLGIQPQVGRNRTGDPTLVLKNLSPTQSRTLAQLIDGTLPKDADVQQNRSIAPPANPQFGPNQMLAQNPNQQRVQNPSQSPQRRV